MRIKFDPPAKSKNYGKKRVKTKFLFFPKKINHELRWLEKAMWVQKVDYDVKVSGSGYSYESTRKYYWKDIDWLDNYQKEESDIEWLDL